VVVTAGVTVIGAVVAAVLQTYVPPPEAVSVADAPAQMIPSLLAAPEVSVTAIAAVGIGLTVMTCVVKAVQPLAAVTVTVYVVVAAGVTGLAAVAGPLLHT
jgi:hypothetical protein